MVLLDRVVFCCVLFFSFSYSSSSSPALSSWVWPRAWRQQRSSAPAFHHLITCSLHTPVSPLLGARLFRNQRWSLVPLNLYFVSRRLLAQLLWVAFQPLFCLAPSAEDSCTTPSRHLPAWLPACSPDPSTRLPDQPNPGQSVCWIRAIRSLTPSFLPRWDK